MVRVFFLGATGHIGGAVVDTIVTQHRNIELRALVRDEAKGRRLEERYDSVQAVVGELKDMNLIESESKAAEIVINTSPDLIPSGHVAIKAALDGLASRSPKGFYIQTSGAFLIAEDVAGERASDYVWDDVEDIDRLKAMPATCYHQPTDQIVRDAADNVNVAIISPTVVYGLSASTENPIPITLRDIVAAVRALGAGFTLSKGQNILAYVHVNDLASIYDALLSDALKGAENSDSRLWGTNAYYLASSEELSFAEYMRAVVKVLVSKGIILKDPFQRLGKETGSSAEEAAAAHKVAVAHGCGVNVRCRSERAGSLLDWRAREQSLLKSLPEVLDTVLLRAT